MEMEDQSSHHNTQFGIDLRQFITGRPNPPNSSHFPPLIPPPPPPPTPPELFPGHRNLHHHHHHYDVLMFMPPSGLHLHDFPNTHISTTPTITNYITPPTTGLSVSCINTSTTIPASSSSCLPTTSTLITSTGGLDGDGGCFNVSGTGGDIGGTVRWPRQETLTLLEIRSRLDSRFKEANQKGPLWDEVSRIMSEEHGYQRSGKKCREKFENLYKYYKKTKEGKAGRQDGKHYRFFRQLEALYGETSNPASTQETQFVGNPLGLGPFHTGINTSNQVNNNQLVADHNFHSQKLICDSLSLSNSSEFDTTSSEENNLSTATLGDNDSSEKRRKRRSGKSWKTKVKEFLDSQLRKLMERQEAWLDRLTRTLEQKEQERLVREEEWRKREAERVDKEHMFWAKDREWIEARDAALMEALQKLTGRQVINISSPEGIIGAEVVQKRTDQNQGEDACGGILNNNNNNNEREAKDGYNKKRKENSRSSSYFQSNESIYHPRGGEGGGGGGYGGASPSNSNVGNAVSDSCFRFLMSGSEGGEHLWENYHELNLKLNKEDHGNQ